MGRSLLMSGQDVPYIGIVKRIINWQGLTAGVAENSIHTFDL
jgi:hypothetical protein